MTLKARETAALQKLASAAKGAAPHRVARVIADLKTEQSLAEADAEALAATDSKPASMPATSIAAAIAKMARVLETGEVEDEERPDHLAQPDPTAGAFGDSLPDKRKPV
tara:strand:+ start:291 stop:617 length:327 start_codon:yes stop_codon:yes gene_type:complete